METLPLELWKEIYNKCDFKNQLNIKATSKFFHNSPIFNDSNYIAKLQKRFRNYLIEKEISHNDLIKSAIQQNNGSISNTLNFFDSVYNKKQIESLNCIHIIHPIDNDFSSNLIVYGLEKEQHNYDTSDATVNMVTCELCNIVYECYNCISRYYFPSNIKRKRYCKVCNRWTIK